MEGAVEACDLGDLVIKGVRVIEDEGDLMSASIESRWAGVMCWKWALMRAKRAWKESGL